MTAIEAITIEAQNTFLGVIEDHKHIDRILGNRTKFIVSLGQNVIKQDGKVYDEVVLKMSDGTERIIYFYMTAFFGNL